MKNIFFLKLSHVPITIPDHDPRFFFKNCPTSHSHSPIFLKKRQEQQEQNKKNKKSCHSCLNFFSKMSHVPITIHHHAPRFFPKKRQEQQEQNKRNKKSCSSCKILSLLSKIFFSKIVPTKKNFCPYVLMSKKPAQPKTMDPSSCFLKVIKAGTSTSPPR